MIYSAKWEFNNVCNLKCPYCCVPQTPRKELPHGEKLKIIDNIAEMGITDIDFFGKEPLFNDEIFRLIDHAESHETFNNYTFITNGVNLDRYKSEILKSPVKNFTVSFDGGVFRKNPDWNLLSWFTDNDMSVEISIDVHQYNYEDIYKHYRAFEDCGIMLVYIKPIINSAGYEISDGDYVKFIKIILDSGVTLLKRTVIDVPYFFPMTRGFTKDKIYNSIDFDYDLNCDAGKTQIFIACDGKVYGCGRACHTGSIWHTTFDRVDTLKNIKGRHCQQKEGG